MARLRRVLAPVAALWLFCQIGTVALVPVALLHAADAHGEECTCGHGLGAMCPMHHKPASPPADCAMQAAEGSGAAAVLTGLINVAGLVPEATTGLAAAAATAAVDVADAHLRGERSVPPDPPPPRA
jgi:hypothetical protein